MLRSIGWCARTSARVVFPMLLFLAASAPALAAPAFVSGYTSIKTSMALTPQWQRLITNQTVIDFPVKPIYILNGSIQRETRVSRMVNIQSVHSVR